MAAVDPQVVADVLLTVKASQCKTVTEVVDVVQRNHPNYSEHEIKRALKTIAQSS